MSRLYIITLLLFLSYNGNSQDNLKRYLEFAKEQFDKGDYYYALTYYEKAMELDSQTVDILWQIAETNRAYKDYRKAEYYYAKVYDREEAGIYPSSLLQLGLMQKQNGKYTLALETFKRAKKKYYKDKKGYLYQKAKQELVSTVWAKSAVIDTLNYEVHKLPETVNSKNSEFGHGIYNGQLLFSSLRGDSISENEEVYSTSYKTSIYSSLIKDSTFQPSEQVKDLSLKNFSTGNGAFSLDGNRFYFSQCSDNGYKYRCKIMVAYFLNGKWSRIDSLGEIINQPGANTTMPCIANIEGEETLIFASDREGTKGGLDLYYSQIKNGNQFRKPRSIRKLNTLENEVSPWWDSINKRLYFSSTWHNGFGGMDVFYSEYNERFEEAINAGIPINSPANDLYFFKYNDSTFVTSNRIGVNYSKNPTCCSDIFVMSPPEKPEVITPEETLEELNKRLPVTLYFHNDVPNPRSRDTITRLNYITTYNEYTAMLDEYRKEYSSGLKGEKSDLAKEEIEDFFIEYVDKGVSDLTLFRNLLLKELDKGAKINITVKGFASPLAKTDYNVNLTKRRISSLVNYMREYDHGVFVKYLDGSAENGGRVVFSQVPFGEYTANQLTSDNPNDVQNSVYSRSAAIERKIEIQSVSYFSEEQSFAIVANPPVKDAGVIKKGELITETFTIKNVSNKVVVLNPIRIPNECVKATIIKKELAPGESTQVKMNVDTKAKDGFFVESIYISVLNSSEELRLYISSEAK